MKIRGNIFGQSYNMLFKNRTLLVLGIVGAVISTIITLFSLSFLNPSALITPIYSLSFWAGMIVGIIILWLVEIFIGGAIISAASSGSEAELGASIRKAASRYVSLLGASIVSGALSLLAFIPGFALMALTIFGGGLITLIVGAVLVIIPGFYVALRLLLVSVACVAGGKRAIESVGNSWSITKGNLWTILSILLVLGLIAGIVGGITSMINRFAGSFVETLLSYPITIAMVLVYQQLSGSAAQKVKA